MTLRRKSTLLIVGILLASLLVGDIVLAAQENKEYGVPFQNIWETIFDIQDEQEDIIEEQEVVQAEIDKLWTAMNLMPVQNPLILSVYKDDDVRSNRVYEELGGMSITFTVSQESQVIMMFTAWANNDGNSFYRIFLDDTFIRTYALGRDFEIVHIHAAIAVSSGEHEIEVRHVSGPDPELLLTRERELTLLIYPT